MAEPFADDLPVRKPVRHEIGQDLSTLSVHELDERISQLRDEIQRLEGARVAKQASRQAAEGVFKL